MTPGYYVSLSFNSKWLIEVIEKEVGRPQCFRIIRNPENTTTEGKIRLINSHFKERIIRIHFL